MVQDMFQYLLPSKIKLRPSLTALCSRTNINHKDTGTMSKENRKQILIVSSIMFIVASMLSCTPAALKLEEGYLTVNGVDHYYRSVGEGEAFVVLHGGPGMYHDELYPFFLDFARSHRVIFYDQRGNGRSHLAAPDSSNFNVELLVDDLDKLRSLWGIEKINLIGHSWGGLLAMYYAVEHPESMKRLITISSAPVNTELLIQCYENQISRYTEIEWSDLQQLWESEKYMAGDPEVHNQAMRKAEGVLFYDKSKVDQWMAVAAFDSVTARNAVALNDLGRGMKLNIHVQDRLSNIQCPTLIIHSKNDFIVPAAPQLAAELLANSELVVLDKSGHYPHVEVPEALFGAIDEFIAGSE